MASKPQMILAEVQNGYDIDDGLYLMVKLPPSSIKINDKEIVIDSNYINSVLHNLVEDNFIDAGEAIQTTSPDSMVPASHDDDCAINTLPRSPDLVIESNQNTSAASMLPASHVDDNDVSTVDISSDSDTKSPSIEEENVSSSDNSVDFQGVTYRRFINLLRTWNILKDISFGEITDYLQTKGICISKRSTRRLLYRALVKKTILGVGGRRNRKYRVIQK